MGVLCCCLPAPLQSDGQQHVILANVIVNNHASCTTYALMESRR